MTKKLIKILFCLSLILSATACFKINEGDIIELSPITVNEVPEVIDIKSGEELVYEKLVVESELPVTYQWAYGIQKNGSNVEDTEMQVMTVISDKPDIQYTFNRLGSYVLRLRMDNGESILYKYFKLNVNSGFDEGLLLLCNNDEGTGSLSFVKKRSEAEIAENAQEIWDDVFLAINGGEPMKNVTDMYLAEHVANDIQYTQVLVATDDEKGSIYKLDPKTFELYNTLAMKDLIGTSCTSFAGDVASGSNAYYAFMSGADKKTYRYDLFGDFVNERTDASALYEADGGKSVIYRSSMTSSSSYRKPILYNETTLFQPAYGKVSMRNLPGYKIVNFAAARNASKLYVLFRSDENPSEYVIKYSTATLSYLKDVSEFTAESITMDENSTLVGSKIANDLYYNYNDAIYRWNMITEPAKSPVITLPAGEKICTIGTNYMGDFEDGTDETLLYVATYNESRSGDKKGSLYVYSFATHELVASYEGKFDKPVKIMYKYRIS